MRRLKNKGKKGIVWLLTAVMVVGLVPVAAEPIQVQAEETQETETTSTTKTIAGLGTSAIKDPTAPTNDTDAWVGSYVYYGNYDANSDETAEPVKYRVLDASTTDYSADGTTNTMLLDCDSILYYQPFDADGKVNVAGKKKNDWSISDVKSSLNGDGFYNKDGVFTTAEKNAIALSTVDSHALTIDSKTGVNVASRTQSNFVNYVALTGEYIFLLDAEDASNGAYGYSMTYGACKNREKTGNAKAFWWIRSAYGSDGSSAGLVYSDGEFMYSSVNFDSPGVSPAFNVNLQSVIFSSVISGTAGGTGAEYKLTLLDSDMTIKANGDATRYGKTVTIPYSISGNNSANATQVSVLVLDKEYTAGNTNGATVLDYQKLNVDSFPATGTGTYTLLDSLSGQKAGTDYHVYIVAEDVNGEKETDYASTPVEVHLWEAPTVKQMNFGTQGIIDPVVPNSANDAWKGCYVYYGKYAAGSDQAAEPVKYRVLDASTTDYSEADENSTPVETMLLDCDSVLYKQTFDADGEANVEGKKANDWSISDVKNQLNGEGEFEGTGFIDTAFTAIERSAIAESKVATHPLKESGEDGVNVAVTAKTKYWFANYTALNGEKIFLLDAEDVSNGAYGYIMTEVYGQNRKKTDSTGSVDATWWLRSAYMNADDYTTGCVSPEYGIYFDSSGCRNFYVSPALNLNLQSVIFSSASGTSKSSALTSSSTEIGTTTNTDWKLTLLDTDKKVNLTEGRNVTKVSDGTITVPYTYTDNEEATDKEKVNQISVMITDKAYGSENAQILYYGALQNVKNIDGSDSTVADDSTGTGTFALPSGLIGTLGTDYHIYLLAEHVNADNFTDYASEPVEVTTILNEVDTVALSMDAIAELPLETELEVAEKGVSATVTWKKGEAKATGNAELNVTYQAIVTLNAKDGYTFMDAAGVVTGVTLNGKAVNSKDVTLNEDGTLTVACGEYTAVARKVTEVAAPTVPIQFASYYTAENVLSSTELGTTTKVTLEGATQPNPKDMKVEWTLANENGAPYDAAPSATNTFKWTVTASEYATYNVNGKVLEGTVIIQNKASAPVAVDGSQVSVNADGTATYVAPIDKKKTTVTIPNTVVIDGVTYKVTVIEKNAFKNSKIKKITIGNNIETIGANAFYGCKKLTTVKFGKNVTTIGDKAFYKCTALTKVSLPSKVKTIGKQAFYGCKKVTSVTIGKNVNKIGSKAFYGCSKLKTLTIKSTKLTTKKIGSKAFSKTPKSMAVKVPKKKFKAYKSMLIKKGVSKNAKFKKF